MLTKAICISEYESVLMGRKKTFSLLINSPDRERKEALGHIWRFAITNLLHWTPEQALVYLTDELVEQLKLKGTLCVVKGEAPGRHLPHNYAYVLKYAFPKEIAYTKEKHAIALYKSFSEGTTQRKVVKEFFSGLEGIERAGFVLRYLRNTYLSDLSVEELYDFFGSKKVFAWLKKKKVDLAVSSIYDNHPLDFLHENLPRDEQDSFFYYSRILDAEWQKCLAAYRKAQAAKKGTAEDDDENEDAILS